MGSRRLPAIKNACSRNRRAEMHEMHSNAQSKAAYLFSAGTKLNHSAHTCVIKYELSDVGASCARRKRFPSFTAALFAASDRLILMFGWLNGERK